MQRFQASLLIAVLDNAAICRDFKAQTIPLIVQKGCADLTSSIVKLGIALTIFQVTAGFLFGIGQGVAAFLNQTITRIVAIG